MATEKQRQTWQGGTTMLVLVILFGTFFPPILYAQSGGSVVVSPPSTARISDTFKIREAHPVTGARSAHRGLDYATSCGTNFSVPEGGRLGCTTMSGYGGVGDVTMSCGVTLRYAHLQSCNASGGTMVSGGGRGMTGAGTSTGCHLHYEVRINGTAVNPQSAYGQNLCDENVRRQLIEEAQRLLQGQAGGGGGAASPGSQSGPTGSSGNTESVTYVPSGEKDPNTGIVNTGAGYYIVRTTDGRTYTQVDAGGDSATTQPILRPTTTNVVPPGASSNPVTGCGTDTWIAMVNQSVLQTRREDLMNKTFIAKADSVMTYSCFGDFMDRARQTLGVFSESTLWVNRNVDILGKTVVMNRELGQYSLDGALTNSTLEAYEGFMMYFNHDLLGGIASAPGGNFQYSEGGSAQSYAPCGTMRRVWDMAKCLNMKETPMFPKFEELISNDPRKYPSNYACFDTGITQDMINLGKGLSIDKAPLLTHLDKIYNEPNGCYNPVATGVTVYRQQGADQVTTQIEYPDGLCISAGCSYQNGGSGNGTCEVKPGG